MVEKIGFRVPFWKRGLAYLFLIIGSIALMLLTQSLLGGLVIIICPIIVQLILPFCIYKRKMIYLKFGIRIGIVSFILFILFPFAGLIDDEECYVPRIIMIYGVFFFVPLMGILILTWEGIYHLLIKDH